MDLAAYLDRINYRGPRRTDLQTLKALHRAHLTAIPYENIDVQLGRPLVTDPAAAYARIVGQGRRGGWCYEMNGLFGWALGELGFSVTRMAGGVVRELLGDQQIGNHLVLRVDFEDGPWIADVGFGDGPIEAHPLKEGAFEQEGFPFALSRIADGWWRLHNHPEGGGRSFDFQPLTADEAVLSAQCVVLQTADASPFVQNLVVQRPCEGGIWQLRGRTLRKVEPGGVTQHLVGSKAELTEVLDQVFDVHEPETPRLWEKACARHVQLFGEPV
jgi:N-hydroxyarylamine O-acetyltransferase